MKCLKTNICQECGEEFKTEGGLHIHLKKHSLTQEQYYLTHFPRFDMYTGKPLPFKNYNDYSTRLFADKRNEFNFIKKKGYAGLAKSILDLNLKQMLSKKGRFPSFCEWRSSKNLGYDKMDFFPEFFKSADVDGFKYFDVPELKAVDGMVLTDSREQKPLFEDSICSINVGDYIFEPAYYNGIHIDRKSLPDFISTFTNGLTRFTREAKKAQLLGVYLVVLIESSFMESFNYRPSKWTRQRVTGENAFHGLRQISREFDNVQFLFVKDRNEAKTYIRRILSNPDIVKEYDLQYLYQIGKF